jgi:hypothetical protein
MARRNARLHGSLARDGRLMFLLIVAVLLVGGGIGTFLFFRNLASADLVAARQLVDQLQTNDETQRKQLNDQSLKINQLETELSRTKATLEAITPSQNTYNVTPNQSLLIGDGRLSLGLVGSPANENVTLNINGRTQTVAVGQVIAVPIDPTTNCRIAVQSFDMFKAVVNAICAGPARPQ